MPVIQHQSKDPATSISVCRRRRG